MADGLAVASHDRLSLCVRYWSAVLITPASGETTTALTTSVSAPLLSNNNKRLRGTTTQLMHLHFKIQDRILVLLQIFTLTSAKTEVNTN